MAPRLRVLAGTSPETMVPITSLVNTSRPYALSSPLFEGQVVAHVKGMTDEQGRVRDSEYFSRDDRSGVTWSIQVQGRFLVPHSADDILFGNTFDRPLKLPWGTSAVLKFMHYIDPTLEHDLTSSKKPWALSPLIATMPNFVHTRVENDSDSNISELDNVPELPFPPAHSIVDDTRQLHLALVNLDADGLPVPHTSAQSSSEHLHVPRRSPSSLSSNSADSHSSRASISSGYSGSSVASAGSSGSMSAASSTGSKISASGSVRIKQAMKKVSLRKRTGGDEDGSGGPKKDAKRDRVKELRKLDPTSAAQRRAHFASRTKRRDIWFGPEDVITTDFCYGFINFAPSLSLQLPGGLSFDLMKYWDGQPVRFVCCERKKDGDEDLDDESDVPWGRIFWCVAIEMVEEGEEN